MYRKLEQMNICMCRAQR